MNFKIGHGYDVHQLIENRDLIIGGVNIPHKMGLLGHSDADVLLHAISDSLLGALALGDIGKHFSDTEESFRGADSLVLLRCVYEMIASKGYEIGNIDATIIAQAPKFAPYIPQMRLNIARALDTEFENVSIKATTEEHLGFTGEEKGISAHAVCLIYKK